MAKVLKLISQFKVGDTFKFPHIKLNSFLTANHSAYIDFKKWNLEQKNKKFFENLPVEYDKLYEDYTLHRSTFNKKLKIFNTNVNEIDTYFFNINSSGDNRYNIMNIIENQQRINKIVSDDDKISLFQMANVCDANFIKPHHFVKIFNRFDVNNHDADKKFLVKEIKYKDDDSKLLKCLIEDTNEIRYLNTKYTDIITELELELIYIKTPLYKIYCILYDKYHKVPIDNHQFDMFKH